MSRDMQNKRARSAISNSSSASQPKRATLAVGAELYEQLDKLLGVLRAQFVAGGGTFTFEAADADSAETRDKILDTLSTTGVVGIINAVDQAGVDEARNAVARGCVDLSMGRVPEEDLKQWLTDGRLVDDPRYRKGIPAGDDNIVYGNCGFAFVYGQRNKFADMPTLTVGDARDVPFEYQPMHRHNLKWLEHHPRILALIMSCARLSASELAHLGRAHDDLPPPMISWDSTKYVYRALDGTKKTLTVPHVDIYSRTAPTYRRQVAIEMSECSPVSGLTRRLCYVPFSNDPRVQRIIAAILGKPLMFERAGYISFAKDTRLFAILDKHALSFNSNHIAMWGDAVTHFEAFCKPCERDPRLAVVVNKRVTRAPLELIRMIVGPHRPTLARTVLMRLAYLCDRGFMPSIYHTARYKDTTLHENMMCAKSTQNYKARRVTARERRLFEFARSAITGDDVANEAIAYMSNALRAMYGLEPLVSAPSPQ